MVKFTKKSYKLLFLLRIIPLHYQASVKGGTWKRNRRQMEDQPLLEIRLLGGFRLTYQNQEIRQGLTTRLETLLAYLVLHRGAPVPRQRLAFLFWPDTSEKQAHTNLRNLLHKLRAVLPDTDRYVSIEQNALQWTLSQRFTLDMDTFTSLASQSTSIAALKDAVQIYTGDLIPDLFDDWLQDSRESLRQTYLTALENLIILLEKDKQLQAALHYAQILLRSDPIREQTYQQLMRLYALCGDRAGVARIYKTCRTVLEQELGVNPGFATDEAYQKSIALEPDWTIFPETTDLFQIAQVAHNLPALLTSFIGREQEREQLEALLSKHRLVTLVGPGGIGKTRLALAVAGEALSKFRDGVFLVDLVPVVDSKSIAQAIADALQVSDEVRYSGLDGLIDHLSDRNLLLLMDNCEHLVEEVGAICIGLLQACPALTILVTSRVALKVYGEFLWQVPALPAPRPRELTDLEEEDVFLQRIQTIESVELFIERATASLPTFSPNGKTLFSIAEICRRLEGMPLAIEMAAARVKSLSVEQIVQRLDSALGLLQHPSASVLPRHRTMEAVMDWSYAMLSPGERKLFARLSVFAGDFSLQAAEVICQGQGIQEAEILDLLASLVDKSLLGNLPTLPEARFRLHEIARQYAHRKLPTQKRLMYWQDRHFNYYLNLVEEAEPKLRNSQQMEWLNRLEREQENLRVALRWGFAGEDGLRSQHTEASARMVGALWMYWFIRGRFSEGRHWAEQALTSLESMDKISPVHGKVLYVIASFHYFQGEFSDIEMLSQKSLPICAAHKDSFGQAVSLHHMGLVALAQGKFDQAEKHLNEGLELATQYGDPWIVSLMISDLAHLSVYAGDKQSAFTRYQQSLEISRQTGDKFTILYELTNMANLAFEQGNLQQATILIEESLSLSRAIGEKRGVSFALNLQGRIAMQEGAYWRADKLLKQSLQIIWDTRDQDSIIGYLINLADNATREERFEFAARLLAACEAAKERFPAGYRLADQKILDRVVEYILPKLAEGTFTAAWTLGRLMNLEQAVSYALFEDPR